MRRGRVLGLLWLSLAACGGGDDDAPADPDAAVVVVDAEIPPDANPCPREPAPADRPRKIVVSLPYDMDSQPSNRYRLLDLNENGSLTTTTTFFELGRAFTGEIVFTPDGEVGLVAQNDGSIGVFTLIDGMPAVVNTGFTGGFYADTIVMSPDGGIAYVLDNQWRESGGGVHRVAIGCDGSLTDLGLWFAAKLPAGLVPRGDRAVLAAVDVGASTAGDDVHLLDWSAAPTPAPLDGADAFPDDQQIVGGVAVTADGAHALVGDYQGITETPPNRVAVLAVGASQIAPVQTFEIRDPLDIVTSPYDDTALVVSGLDDAVVILDYNPGASPPFTLRGEPPYLGGAPTLPAHAVMIERGSLRGLVVLAELSGVRRLRFTAGGGVTDLGRTFTGGGVEGIVGAIGVQP